MTNQVAQFSGGGQTQSSGRIDSNNGQTQANRNQPGHSSQNSSQSSRATSSSISRRSHLVQSGENPASIARKYSIKVESLMAANPGLDPRKLKVGQTLAIPAS